jgi:hypothetical protein
MTPVETGGRYEGFRVQGSGFRNQKSGSWFLKKTLKSIPDP